MTDLVFTSVTAKATIDGVEHIGSPVTVDQAQTIFAIKGDAQKLNGQLISATFGIDFEKIGELPYPVYSSLLTLALDINGLGIKGEDKAPTAPVAEPEPLSTSDLSAPTS